MKIIILHGDNVDSLYKRLDVFKNEAKKRGWEIRLVDIKDNISEQLSFRNLFLTNVIFILSEAGKLTKRDIEWINKEESNDVALVLYSESTLNKSYIGKFQNISKVEEYKLPVLIWKLLESIYPGNVRNCIKLLHEVLKKDSPDFVFALISRHARDLYWSNLENNKLDYPNWRISKLRSQSRKFPKNQLKSILKILSEIDVKVKTGKDNLFDSLDFLFATQLE